MVKLDIKDRKILYELDLNCRQSNSQIGKKVGLKRDVVAYRIKKMQDEGIIKNFWTVIDTFKLGYNVIRVYINFQYITPEIKKEIIQYFVDYNNSWAVISVKTEIDLVLIIWVKDFFDFYKFWEKTLDKYEDYFSKYTFSLYIQGDGYKKTYLFANEDDRSDKKLFTIQCGGNPIKIDETDYRLLNEIAVNARIPLVNLAKLLDQSSQNINYRIKNLVSSGVIRGFRVDIELSKIGLQRYKPNIYLKDHRLKKPIYNFLKNKSYLEYMNLAFGLADLEPEFIVKDYDELLKILDEINLKFSGAIKKQSIFIADKVYKLRCMPEIIF